MSKPQLPLDFLIFTTEVFKGKLHYLGGDYMIPVYQYEISTRPAGTFHPTVTWGNQISSREGGTVFHLVFV